MRNCIALFALMAATACAQDQVAELVDHSRGYYGRNGTTENGQPVARYSDSRRAMQSNDVAYKYQSSTQTYGVDAPMDKVEVSDIGAPGKAPANSPFGKASKPLTPEEMGQAPAPAAQVAENSSTVTPAKGPIAFRWPANGKVISRFGPKTDGLSNDGVNIAAKEGEPIWAAADGEVVYVGNGLEGYGNLLILRHREGWMSSYAHAKEFLLKKGDTVAQGDLMGYVGRTGSVKTPQLHFSLREGKTPIDPESVLNKQVAKNAN